MSPRVLLLLLLALTGLAIAITTREPVPRADEPVTTPTTTFAAGFLEHLVTVQEAGEALVDLGERRERNLLVVGQRQSAMNAALDATDAWLDGQPAHHHDPAVVAYRTGAASIRQAMADAQSAFLRFDWDSIAAANVSLNEGVDDIRAASAAISRGESR